MSDIFDYLNWRGDLTFSQNAFHEVDGLLLSTFSYLTPPNEVLSQFPINLKNFWKQIKKYGPDSIEMRNPNDYALLGAMAECPRYQNAELLHFSNMTDSARATQFAAYCIRLTAGSTALVYRGTDHTITGWKEDFNLSFLDTVPGQDMALELLCQEAQATQDSLILCGHSKGGNLAVYAATSAPADLQERITDVYNYDGPGFRADYIQKPSYTAMLSRLHTFQPESSIVGILFEHAEAFESILSSNVGPAQHEPYSWEIMGAHILRATGLSTSGQVMDQALRDWLTQQPLSQREQFTEALFGLLAETDASSLEDIKHIKTMFSATKTFSNYSEEEQEMLLKTISALGRAIKNSLKATGKKKIEQLKEESKR